MNSTRSLFSNVAFHVFIIAVLAGILLFSNLHIGGLSGYDDAIFAHESKEMLRTGDWWNIRKNGYPHFDYPPFYYWMQAASMSVLGPTDFAAKFPSALSGWFLILLTFFFARRLTGDPLISVIAAWVLMLTQYFMKYATHAMSDVPFALFFALALFLYHKGNERKQYLVLCGAAICLCIMTRSILGTIPIGIILSHIFLTRRYDLLRTKELILGFVLAISLPAIWYVSMFSIHGNSFAQGYSGFVFEKMASAGGPSLSSFIIGLFKYPMLLLKSYQPWLLFAIVGFIIQFRKARNERDANAIFLVFWVCLVLIPFSLVSAKILRYIMPLFAAAAILSAIPLGSWLRKLIKPRYQIIAFSSLCVLVLLIAAFPNPRHRAAPIIEIAPALIAATRPQERLLLYTSGVLHHDVENQLLWYTERYFHHIGSKDDPLSRVGSDSASSVVIDRKTFDEQFAARSGEFEIIIATDHYVCFRRSQIAQLLDRPLKVMTASPLYRPAP